MGSTQQIAQGQQASPAIAIAPALRAALVCPDCRKPIAQRGDALECSGCGVEFSFEQGVPRLLPASRAKALDERIEAFREPHREVRQNSLARALIPPNPICDPGEHSRHARVKDLMSKGLILNLGSKSASWGAHVSNIDLVLPAGHSAAQPAVQLLADIERLPFADASVDGVICTYVLEHVGDARACMDEIARVVRPGGAVYVTVPFLFPTHPDPLDRWRWTLDGLRYSMRAFEEIEVGTIGGPFSTYVAIAPTLIGSAFSNFYLYNCVRFTLGWLLWPLKFLDYLAWRSKRSDRAPSNVYFIGRKS